MIYQQHRRQGKSLQLRKVLNNMTIKQVTVGVQRVINLGNYENVRYECTAVAEVPEGMKAQDVYDASLQFCKENVLAEITRIDAQKEEARLANRKGK